MNSCDCKWCAQDNICLNPEGCEDGEIELVEKNLKEQKN